MKVCLKKYGTDLNGTIYTKESLQDAVNKIDRAVGTQFNAHNLTLEDDGIYGEVDILESPPSSTIDF